MYRILINGIVQGVGFRPFVYKIAVELGLKGFVLNSTNGVQIEVEGSEDSINTFVHRIKTELPPASIIKEFTFEKHPDKNYQNFEIKISSKTAGSTLISPDLAICEDCVNEFNDPKDPRFQYAFINCTNCGPRYSIIENTPYDRQFTSMKHFKMCDYCKDEYTNPLNRRFHAQPVACPECGPQLKFLDKTFREVEGDPIQNTISVDSCSNLLRKNNYFSLKKEYLSFNTSLELTTTTLSKKRSSTLINKLNFLSICYCCE